MCSDQGCLTAIMDMLILIPWDYGLGAIGYLAGAYMEQKRFTMLNYRSTQSSKLQSRIPRLDGFDPKYIERVNENSNGIGA